MIPLAIIVAGFALWVGMAQANRNVPRGTLPAAPRRDGQRIGNVEVETPRFTPATTETPTPAARPATSINDLYRKHARATGLDWLLLKAVAVVESGENPNAINPADPSYGIMQILCSGAPGPGNTCTNRLPAVEDWPPTRETLMDPDFNIYFGSQILAWNVQRFGLPKGIAVYNSWAANTAPSTGPFPNQRYVDKVRAAYVSVGGQDARVIGSTRRLVAA